MRSRFRLILTGGGFAVLSTLDQCISASHREDGSGRGPESRPRVVREGGPTGSLVVPCSDRPGNVEHTGDSVSRLIPVTVDDFHRSVTRCMIAVRCVCVCV
jgi:hypothetical protein